MASLAPAALDRFHATVAEDYGTVVDLRSGALRPPRWQRSPTTISASRPKAAFPPTRTCC
jgi:hypothetical protein